MADRSNRAETRKPVVGLPAYEKLVALPDEAKAALADVLSEIQCDAAQRADKCWKKHKAPMAAYWKAVSVYSGHIRRSIRRTA